MAKNLRKTGPPEEGHSVTHNLTKFTKLDFKDEDSITFFLTNNLSDEEMDRARAYIRTLRDDESLDLTNFEIKRIAVAMLALDRGDNWFFRKEDDKDFQELSIELQKFLAGKEVMIVETLRKSKTADKKPKSLWDQLDNNFKTYEIKAEGTVEGVEYVFETKKKAKPKMLTVVVTEEKEDGGDESESKASDSKKEKKDES